MPVTRRSVKRLQRHARMEPRRRDGRDAGSLNSEPRRGRAHLIGIWLLGLRPLSAKLAAPAPGVGPYSHTRPPPNFAGSAPSPFAHPLTPISGFPFPYFADPRVPLASRLRERFLQKIGSTPTLHTVRRRQNGRPTKNLRPPPNFLYFGEKYRLPGKFLVGPWFGRRLTQ